MLLRSGTKTFPALRKVGGARPKGTMNAEGNEDGTATQSISALASALQQLMVTQARPAAKRRAPQFSGSPEEDPETFLRKAEEYFQENTHQDDIVEAVAECLTKQAAQWFKTVKYQIDWTQFQEEFLLQFDGVEAKAKLKVDLFSKPQKAEESCANFIRGKQLLAARLKDTTSEEILTAVCRQLMKVEIGQALSYPYPSTYLELIRATSAIQALHNETKRTKKAPSSTKTHEEPPRQAPGPPKCWYCPGHHFNRDCPERRTPALPEPRQNATTRSEN